MYNHFFKRAIDIIFALLALLILSPLFLIITLCLLISNQGSPFFFQYRPGKDKKIFKVIKFKTMTDEKDCNGNLLPDAKRLKKTGAFVRSISLDEIPQLLNVLKGEMSLIGPRPLLIEYLPLYNQHQALRHNVRPGITGWAQVNGRNSISWSKKFEYDVWYVEHITFLLDLKIICMTIKKVIIRDGINSEISVTMEEFKGN